MILTGEDKVSFLKRFADKIEVDPESDCWIWIGAKNSKGYPQIRINGKTHYSHRLSHIVFHGEIPEGEQVHHVCMNRCCVNPDHIQSIPAKLNRALQAAGTGDVNHFDDPIDEIPF